MMIIDNVCTSTVSVWCYGVASFRLGSIFIEGSGTVYYRNLLDDESWIELCLPVVRRPISYACTQFLSIES
jgi:hypothetical protein